MLFLYFRIFSLDIKTRVSVYICMAINTAYMISFFITFLIQCRPIRGAWMRWDGTFDGQCVDVNVMGYLNASLNIVLDIMTLALPLPLLARLSLSRRKKITTMAMFSVGFMWVHSRAHAKRKKANN